MFDKLAQPLDTLDTWDCVKDETLYLTQKDAQLRNKWRKRIKGATG